jgi:hypothetical protein
LLRLFPPSHRCPPTPQSRVASRPCSLYRVHVFAVSQSGVCGGGVRGAAAGSLYRGSDNRADVFAVSQGGSRRWGARTSRCGYGTLAPARWEGGGDGRKLLLCGTGVIPGTADWPNTCRILVKHWSNASAPESMGVLPSCISGDSGARCLPAGLAVTRRFPDDSR